MFIEGFVWLPEIVEKLEAKHHASQDEAEEVFFNNPKFRFVESGLERARMYTQQVGKRTAGAT